MPEDILKKSFQVLRLHKIVDNGKHADRCVMGFSQLKILQFPIVPSNIEAPRPAFFSGAAQHFAGSVYARYLIALGCQYNRVIPCSATEIEDRLRFLAQIFLKNTLQVSALFFVILTAVKNVVIFSVTVENHYFPRRWISSMALQI